MEGGLEGCGKDGKVKESGSGNLESGSSVPSKVVRRVVSCEVTCTVVSRVL